MLPGPRPEVKRELLLLRAESGLQDPLLETRPDFQNQRSRSWSQENPLDNFQGGTDVGISNIISSERSQVILTDVRKAGSGSEPLAAVRNT